MRNYLKDLSCHYQGQYQKIKAALQRRQAVPSYDLEVDFVCFGDLHYPQQFYEMTEPPWVLFYKGDWSLLSQPCLSMVGTRQPDAYGKEMARCLSSYFAKRFVIVSGLARGIDTICHQAALVSGRSIGFLGCGLDVVYPPENKVLIDKMGKEHLLCSEYPPTTKPLGHHFPVRNRLIVAASRSLIIVQAQPRSGSTSSVTQALANGREVYCVPHRFDDKIGEANNQLISLGAQILTKEILQDIV